jgi:hypothetical protein
MISARHNFQNELPKIQNARNNTEIHFGNSIGNRNGICMLTSIENLVHMLIGPRKKLKLKQ